MTVDLKKDQELADEVRRAAGVLCEALERAGKARLDLSVSFQSYAFCQFADGTRETSQWKANIGIRRINLV